MADAGPFDVRVLSVAALSGPAAIGRIASGATNLELTQDLLWVMIGISVAASIITFAFLVYSVWRFRDRSMRGRRYG